MSSIAPVRGFLRSFVVLRAWILPLIACIAGVAALNWETAALNVTYAQGGLVAAFNFDEGSGSIVNDVSGLGNNGAVANAQWTASGRYGGALSFEDRGDLVTIADHPSLDLANAFTLEAWIRPASSSNIRTVLLKEGPGGFAYALYSNNSGQRPIMQARVGDTTFSALGNNRLSTGVWTHLAATYDGSSMRLYLNGVGVFVTSMSGTINNSSMALRLGGTPLADAWYRGLIDDVRIYNRSLSAAEIQADMVTPVGDLDSTAPEATLTAPADGSTVSGNVAVAATATDDIGVGGVQFYLDGATLGPEDTTAPYVVSWDTRTVANGPHTLTATAHDEAGNTASSTVTVTVNNAPRLLILQPPGGATITGSTVAISYSTQGDVTEVQHVHFSLDGGPVQMDLTFDGAYQIENVPAGTHTLTGYLARADHSQIAGSESTPVTFTTVAPDTPPSVSLTAPASGSSVAGSVTVQADATDDKAVAGVQFLIDGAAVGGEDTTAPYQMVWDSRHASNGAHVILARARDDAGNTATSTVTVTVNNPRLLISQPAAGVTVTSATIAIAYSTTGDLTEAHHVHFSLDGGPVLMDLSFDGAYQVANLANGPHTLTGYLARSDHSQIAGSDATAVTFTVAIPDEPPTVTLTAPVAGSTIAGSVTVQADATDDKDVAGVQFLVDGTAIGGEDSSAPYEIAWDSRLVANGPHTITARARDVADNTTSTSITVTVNNVPPRLTILQPAGGAGITGTTVAIAYSTQGDLNDARHAHFSLDGRPVQIDLSLDGVYQLDDVAAGTHTLTGYLARADHSQIAGSEATPVTFTTIVPDEPPTVAIITPVAGSSVVGTVTVRADADDDKAVTGVQFFVDGSALGGEDTAAPYEITWDSRLAANGPHTITARARDAADNTASTSITVTVNNVPPRLVILQPLGGASITGTTVAIAYSTQGDLNDARHAHFSIDGGPVQIDLDLDGVYQVDVTAGTHTLTGYLARADHSAIAGSEAIAVTFTIAVPDEPPSITITAPVNGSSVAGTVTVRTDAEDDKAITGVQFFVDGSPVGGEDTAAPYEITWDSRLASNGPHVISARARDAAGNIASSAVSVTVNNPRLQIVQPANGASITGASIAVAYTTTGDLTEAHHVHFSLDAGPVLMDLSFDGVYQIGSATSGAHTLTGYLARADHSHITGSDATPVTFTVIIPDTPPTVVITSPVAGNVAGTVTVRADAADDNAVAGVQFFLDGAALGGEDVAAPYELAWDSRTATNGTHAITARARDSAGNMASASVTVTVNNIVIDPPPSVSVTSPLAGSTVSGSITLRANAADDLAVIGVQFLLDDAPVGSEDTTAPYEITWDSRTTSNATHAISARARDGAGNTSVSAAISIAVANTAPPTGPAVTGQWSAPITLPIVAIHQALLPSGKVLMWDAADFTTAPPILFDPATNTYVNAPATSTDLFCAGHAMLADGRLLTVGGDTRSTGLGVRQVNLFDPATGQWSSRAPMAFRRWYPTATTLSDGRVFVLSGYDDCYGPSCLVARPEMYNPTTNVWTSMATADYITPSYPFLFETPDGGIIAAGSYEGTIDTRVLDLATGTWSVLDSNPIDAGSAVMYEPGKIMKSGKWANSDPPFVAAHGNTYVLDLNAPSPQWRATAPMTRPRAYNMLTLLPDGTTLATGGSRSTDPGDGSQGVLDAEVWSPVTETWTTLARMRNPRLYHGTSMLLPDGRVLVAGSGRYGSPEQFNAEIFSPPYLFKGPRPVISSAPEVIEPGSTFSIATPNTSVAAVTMIRIGSMTHSFSTDQRFLSLPFTAASGSVTATAPANPRSMTPGYYMLFLVDESGVPSMATFVRVPATSEDSEPPSAPGNLSATGSIGSIALTWSAATDNTAVMRYDVHRSQSQGFTPSAATLIGSTSGVQHVDNTVTAGTYYYRVIAVDTAGNAGAASNEASAAPTTDLVPPAVLITAPASGTSVSGAVTVSATATDNVAVAGVTFMLDGAAIGAEDTAAPFSISWNAGTATAGLHRLTAIARDAAGNTATSVAVEVTVTALAPQGLIASLGFDEGAGTATTDSSGRGHHGTLSNATWTPSGRFGAAVNFNGSSSWITLAPTTALNLTTGMTLSAWVRPTSITSDFRTVILKENNGGLSYALYATDGASRPPAGYINTGGSDVAAVAPSTLALNTWTHLAVTYDGASMRLYVNGALVSTRAAAGSIAGTNGAVRIGGNAVWGEYFSGTIDEVRLYSRALSAADIQADMARAINPPATP